MNTNETTKTVTAHGKQVGWITGSYDTGYRGYLMSGEEVTSGPIVDGQGEGEQTMRSLVRKTAKKTG